MCYSFDCKLSTRSEKIYSIPSCKLEGHLHCNVKQVATALVLTEKEENSVTLFNNGNR